MEMYLSHINVLIHRTYLVSVEYNSLLQVTLRMDTMC